MSVQDLVAGTLGLFLGLIIANLVGLAFISVPYIGPYVSVALSIILGYLGMHLAVSKKSEMASWFHFHSEPEKKKNKDKKKASCWTRISSSTAGWRIFTAPAS